jgi:hypothetical protein
LKTLARFKQEGIACGMFLMPVVPFFTDTPQMLDRTLRTAKEHGLDFVVFGGMTLKDGRQKEYFMQKLQERYPELTSEYHMIYPGDKWGGATGEYYHSLNQTFHHFAKKYHLPKRIPAHLFNDILSENDLVAVILDQLDYLLKSEERTSPYGYAAYSVLQLKVPISTMKKQLRTLKGVGKVTERLILEILNTGTSAYYEKLLSG